MITGRTIVCFASGWNYHPTSKHHIMRKLAEHNRVVWVNWHASRRPGLSMDDLRQSLGKLGQIRRGANHVTGNLTVLTPPQVPLPGSTIARRMNTLLVRRAIRRQLQAGPPQPVQIWSFAPDVSDLVGSFGEELVMYYCVDAFGEFPGYDRELILRRERELIDRCDLVLTTSSPLYEAKKELHPRVHLVKHGVDHAHLSQAVNANLVVPADLARLPRPIFGFVGVVGEWVDLDIMAGLARRRPDASVVIIGPSFAARGPLAGLPNVHWLGPRDHAALPAYLRGFDVGLIPFRKVPLTHHANPIKLFEYLAAGLPVVSSPLPAVYALPNEVWLADDADTTAAACAEALRHNTPADQQRRSRLMEAESWKARLDTISDAIQAALRARQPVISSGHPARLNSNPASSPWCGADVQPI